MYRRFWQAGNVLSCLSISAQGRGESYGSDETILHVLLGGPHVRCGIAADPGSYAVGGDYRSAACTARDRWIDESEGADCGGNRPASEARVRAAEWRRDADVRGGAERGRGGEPAGG